MKITERGWAGHFICGNECNFRRNTLIEHLEHVVVVSTVGMLIREEQVVEIGCNRYYETMCFIAEKKGNYWEADVRKEVPFDSKWRIEKLSDNSDNEANEMHQAVVAEIVTKLKKGILQTIEGE